MASRRNSGEQKQTRKGGDGNGQDQYNVPSQESNVFTKKQSKLKQPTTSDIPKPTTISNKEKLNSRNQGGS